ncbi:PQQ-binding-like beta-propeller repeat protein [Nocardiopsis sp. CNR-923]|uniref:outer membrane protein assembly factor BamB family protein n=1 Tax=Nocardiopsis sp. CNR-923 TaxID=1904965 RepID=UPI0021CC99BF|nr:PQQ-binding-like beta-propeller repeat protein [Nocardiopsis sp. CNR-923]
MVELEAGLIGLRGDTGEELWRYPASDDEDVGAEISADGTHAVVRSIADDAEPTAVLLDTTTGAIVQEVIGWDGQSLLVDDERQVRRHFDGDGLLVEVADLVEGQALWGQEEPASCTAGGLSRQVSSIVHPAAIVLVVYCADDVSEGALYSPSQQATHALVALDPGSGEELWRYESTEEDTEGFLPDPEVARFGDVLVARFPGVSDHLLFDIVDGDLVAESPGPVLDVTEETYLARGGQEGDSSYELRGFDGQVLYSVAADPVDAVVALDEGMVRVRMERGPDGDPIDAEVTLWEEGEGTVVETGLVVESASRSEPGRLLRVPGAVLLYPPVAPATGADEIGHIVALQ